MTESKRATAADIASGTPASVDVTMEARAPYADPTMGVALPAPPPRAGRPRHRLVAIGDSITHGFQSGAIFNTRLSWPMIVAWEMGADQRFRFPTYEGFGGLPLNIEYVIRRLEARFGDRIDWWETGFAAFEVRQAMAEIEDWWERGPGSVVPRVSGIMHNLAVYGWDLRDALHRDAANLAASIARPRDNVLSQLVENANERAALRVYESARGPGGTPLTVFGGAAALGAEGELLPDGTTDAGGDGIETLVVFLGANNALGSVVKLKVIWSDAGYDDLERKSAFNVWQPSHFDAELARVVAAVKAVKARHVIFVTVPHVTILPVAKGVGSKIREDSRYFPYYTRPWVTDAGFDPKDDPCITALEARAVDSAIDQYNDSIARSVHDARREGRDWYVLDIAGILDRAAQRRYIDSIPARPSWWTRYELPPELQALTPDVNSRFYASGPRGRTDGGLFSLDGVHPTTITYGLIAQEIINVMQLAGVKFFLGDGVTERQGPVRVDFNRLIKLDTLISDPPRSVTADLELIGWLDDNLDLFRRILPFN